MSINWPDAMFLLPLLYVPMLKIGRHYIFKNGEYLCSETLVHTQILFLIDYEVVQTVDKSATKQTATKIFHWR